MKLATPSSVDFDMMNVGTAGLEISERPKNEIGSLLPVLPDEITIKHILPRVSWRVLLILARLNRVWHEALKSPDIYDVRVYSSMTETIVTIHQYECTVFLYDTSTDTWHRLPHLPFGRMLVARGCGCVCMCGKLYILGGNQSNFQPRNEVYVFDLAGQGQWKQCTSMKTARKYFAYGVKDGRIYVFGGSEAGSAGEVYDPKLDVWHDIAPMLSSRIEHKAVKVGDTFCVQMGRYYAPDSRTNYKWPLAHFCEIYDPGKDRWTKVENFTINSSTQAKVAETAVVIDGRLHMILDDWLYLYEEPLDSRETLEPLKWDGSGSWKAVQYISWDVLKHPGAENHSNIFSRWSVAIASGQELLALVFGQTANMNERKWILLKSQGLGRKDQKLVWKRIQFSNGLLLPGSEDALGFPFSPCICTIPGAW